MPIHAGLSIIPVQEVAHWIIPATRALHGDLLHQGSRPTWEKLLSRTKKPLWTSTRPSTWSSFTKTHRRSHSEPPWEEMGVLCYRHATTPPMWPQHSLRPPPLTLPHWRTLGAAKNIQIAHDQWMVKPRHPVRLTTKTVTARQWQVLEKVTATQIMSILPKTRPRARPKPWTRRTHQRNGGNERGSRGQVCRTRMTEGTFLPHWRARNSRAWKCQDQPASKPPTKWLHANSQHLVFTIALTPGRHIGGLCRASDMPSHWGQQCCLSSARVRPPRRLHPRRQLHDICCLPGLSAPKYRWPLGWRNHGRQ